MTKVLYLSLVSATTEGVKEKCLIQRQAGYKLQQPVKWILLPLLLTCVFIDGNTFQNLNVSSPAPVTIVYMMNRVLDITNLFNIQKNLLLVYS